MGFRINRGIFQYKKDDGTFANKFMLDKDSGRIMEVDEDGNMTDGYLKLGEKASDSDKLDGIDSGAFLRSNADDNVSGHTEWQDGKQIRLGNGADFRMWFDGSHTVFRNYNHGNGNIYFQGEDTAGANHALLYMFTANTRPYVSLYEDGGERFRTKSNGVEVLGDAFINQGRIHIKRGTGLTHAEWEDDSSANGRAQLILDSHYSDLIIASRNANNNKHGSTLTLATQSTSTNDVAKWVIGQGQYQEGAHIMAFAYGVNHTNPHSILGTDNGNAEMLLTNGSGLWLRNNLHANQVFMQSITSDGDIANDKGSYLHIGGWGVGRTAANAVLVNTAYRADYATNLFNENISRFANDANYLTQDALTSVEEGLRAEINGVETVANSKQDAGNYATFTNNITLNNSATTANFIAELTNEHGAFQNNYKAFKVTWSYAGNSNLDVGFESVELAGCLVECWGGTYKHVRLTRPTTGTGGRSIYVYNDQGSGYAPGWRQIWTSDEFSSTSVSNWNTAYGWGNHASAGYLTTTGKAADSDKLDGYDWMQSGKSVRANEFYADNWFRNYNVNEGLYNEATGTHFVSNGSGNWTIRDSDNGIELRLQTNGSTTRGYVYANNSNEVGFLDAGGSWAIRHYNDSGTDFYTDNGTREFIVGRDRVSGSFGTVQTSTTRGGWGGYSINGQYVFMSNHVSDVGIYNDIDNEWMTIWRRNGSTELMHNGAKKLETTSSGVNVTGNVVASGSVTASSFSGNGSGLTGVSAPIPFTTVIGEATACVSMNFDGRAMVFTMADGTSYSIDGARPNE